MQALLFGLTFPVIPLLVWKVIQTKEQVTGKELIIRYGIYTLVQTFLTSAAMFVLCDEGTSFQDKMDRSPSFVLKYVLMELIVAAVIAVAEWMYTTRKLTVRVAWQEYANMGIVKFAAKWVWPVGLYLMAILVVALNTSLLFDNVLWGDECFSANTAQKSAEGIMQVLYFWDNHPPLHYYWTKMFGEILGHSGPVYHLAAVTPFYIGIVTAVTFLRKRFGNIPTAFFVVVTGLAMPCLQYNVEIRMYSLAFMGVALSYYCAYRVLGGNRLAWFGMVFWGLVAAYSHYYAMMSAGLIVFITGVAVSIRFKGKTWVKALLALVGFIVGYAPWIPMLCRNTESVSNDWWMSEVMPFSESLQMVLCGIEYEKLVLFLLVLFLGVLLIRDSSFFGLVQKKEKTELTIHRPTLQKWSTETYAVAVGGLVIVGTLTAAYLLCLIMGPVLTQRYLYPLSAVTVLLLVFGSKGFLDLVQELGRRFKKAWLHKLAKAFLVLMLAVLTVIGLGNYHTFREMVNAEAEVTMEALDTVGDVPEDTVLISNNVKHLAWTVLYYYYPDNEIITGRCSDEGKEYAKFWYYTPEGIDDLELQEMIADGYDVTYHGSHQIAVYPFELYYCEKVK